MAAQHIIVGCDLHEKNMVLFMGADHAKPYKRTWRNTGPDREKMIAHLKQFAQDRGAKHIAFAYEASCLCNLDTINSVRGTIPMAYGLSSEARRRCGIRTGSARGRRPSATVG